MFLARPYTPTGWLHAFWREHWGQTGPTLVWKAPTLLMNPTLDSRRVAAAIARDPERGRAEWEAEWRSGVNKFLEPALVDACARRDPVTLPSRQGVTYAAGADPSGGGADEFAWAIAHREDGRVVVDLVAARGRRGRLPLDLDGAVRDCAEGT